MRAIVGVLEQVRAVFEAPDDCAAALLELQQQVELRGVVLHVQLADGPPRGMFRQLGLQHEGDLEQWVPGRVTLALETFDEFREGVATVGKGLERTAVHAREIAKGGRPTGPCA